MLAPRSAIHAYTRWFQCLRPVRALILFNIRAQYFQTCLSQDSASVAKVAKVSLTEVQSMSSEDAFNESAAVIDAFAAAANAFAAAAVAALALTTATLARCAHVCCHVARSAPFHADTVGQSKSLNGATSEHENRNMHGEHDSPCIFRTAGHDNQKCDLWPCPTHDAPASEKPVRHHDFPT